MCNLRFLNHPSSNRDTQVRTAKLCLCSPSSQASRILCVVFSYDSVRRERAYKQYLPNFFACRGKTSLAALCRKTVANQTYAHKGTLTQKSASGSLLALGLCSPIKPRVRPFGCSCRKKVSVTSVALEAHAILSPKGSRTALIGHRGGTVECAFQTTRTLSLRRKNARVYSHHRIMVCTRKATGMKNHCDAEHTVDP